MNIRFKPLTIAVSVVLLSLSASCGSKNSASDNTQQDSALAEDTEIVTASEPVKARGLWDEDAMSYVDEARNIQWSLDAFQNWTAVNEDRIPSDMLLAALNDDHGLCVTLVALPMGKGQKWSSISEVPQELVMNKTFDVQTKAFPGAVNQKPSTEKVKFLTKDALKVCYESEIPDNRYDEEAIIPFASRMIAFVSGDEILELTVMVPQDIIDEFGDEVYDVLFSKFGYTESN